MNTPHLAWLFAGPIITVSVTVALGAGYIAFQRFRSIALVRMRELRHLSEAGNARLNLIAELPNPFQEDSPSGLLSGQDLLTTYLNSRENLRIANCAHIESSERSELSAAAYLVQRLAADHRKIRALVLGALFEKTLGRLVPGWYPVYANALLWTYSEEQELLLHLAAHCSPRSSDLLLTRV